MRLLCLSLLSCLILSACGTKESTKHQVYTFPENLGAPNIPEDNVLTEDRVFLGRKLFYDGRLSADGSISCASCHIQKYAFADTARFSRGFHGRLGFRNAPSLTNVAYVPLLMRDGGVFDLELQALAPIEDTNEMNNPLLDVVERLKDDQTYKALAKKAYNRNLDPYVITKALASFQRTLISANSRYDQYMSGDESVFSDEEKKGYELFMSSNCVDCHTPPHFTNHTFHNNGLVPVDNDSGRAQITGKAKDRGVYRVPTLRNVALTAPYMHNGLYTDLEDVIKIYASGGLNTENQSNIIEPFTLSIEEKKSLIAFLKTLTDTIFVKDKRFGPEFD